jgi:hypothetical protein
MLIIDIKTGKPAHWHEFQVGAYFELAKKGCTDIDFEPEGHKYFRDKIEVPGVTNILKLIQNWNYGGNMEAADKGTYIHKCCALLDSYKLDLKQLQIEEPEAFCYVQQWEKFLFENKLENISAKIEQKYYWEKWNYKFGGTVDREYPNYEKNEMWIVYLQPDDYDIVRIKNQRQLFKDFLCILRTFNIKNGG